MTRIANIIILTTLALLCFSGCGKKLTRDNASIVVSKYLSDKMVAELQFRPEGIERSIKEGYVRYKTAAIAGVPYEFTKKALQIVDVAENDIGRQGIFATETTPFSFRLKSPIPQALDSITGIAFTNNGNEADVEYTSKFAFPQKMEPLRSYLYTGFSGKLHFKLYDDGWRIAQGE